MRDPQQQACYAWEARLSERYPLLSARMGRLEAARLIEDVWAAYIPGIIPPPPVLFLQEGEGDRSQVIVLCSGRQAVKVQRIEIRWTTRESILHELRHAILAEMGCRGWGTHGPRFVGGLVRLLSDYAGVDLLTARQLMRGLPEGRLRSGHPYHTRPRPWAEERELILHGTLVRDPWDRQFGRGAFRPERRAAVLLGDLPG